MRLNTLKYVYEKASGQNPTFYYRGPFLEKFTNTFLEVSSVSGNKETGNSIGKKVSFVLVECFQNILRHSENIESQNEINHDDGMFAFKNLKEAFVINSVNPVHLEEKNRLESLVTQVNSLNESDLKQLYLDNLKNNTISEKGGAGLGLIEMARKSGQKILHRFENIDDKYALFHQQIAIKRNVDSSGMYDMHLDEAEHFYKRMIEEDLVLLYKGDFSQQSILPLLELSEHNVRNKSIEQKNALKAAHVTIEMLQNISKHARSSDQASARFGIFMLGRNESAFCILAGNLVSEEEKEFLEEKLDYLISLDQDELRELHKSTLRATLRFENKVNSGLGLIEVARTVSGHMKYKFYPCGDNAYLFALEVTI
jgi:hypothetical protein